MKITKITKITINRSISDLFFQASPNYIGKEVLQGEFWYATLTPTLNTLNTIQEVNLDLQ